MPITLRADIVLLLRTEAYLQCAAAKCRENSPWQVSGSARKELEVDTGKLCGDG